MKLSILAPPLILLSSSLPSTQAWGGLGHETVAYIASSFLNPEAQIFFQTILGDTSVDYLANVATWADSFRYTQAGKFSAPFHFIDSMDDPPLSCGVAYNRDCGSQGCVVGAIQNYTQRLMDASFPHEERFMAAKFLVHFVGDIHQPLHDEDTDKGGNGIKVTFDGTEVNLHHTWDTNIPEKFVGGYSLVLAQEWAFQLSHSIQSGRYKSQAARWIDGIDVTDGVTSSLVWAAEANAYVCSTVMPEGKYAIEGQELGGAYYQRAVPVVELQIAKAGYRLAAWLNLIASGTKAEEFLVEGDL